MKKYIYNGKSYPSLFSLKSDNIPNVIFSLDAPEELLKEIGITVKEVEDPKPVIDPIMEAKQKRNIEVENITVELDGMIFDGNEKAQDRISRAILGWDEDVDGIEWVLSNDEIAYVTKEQLQKVLQLATAEMQRLWIIPYTNNNEE